MAQSSIVVGTDGSAGARAAVGQAGRLASALGARVVVVSAYSNGASALAPEAMAYTGDQRDAAEEILKLAESELKAAGVECDVRAVCGSAAEAIIEVAELENAEAIVVGSRGMRGARRLLGSVPNAVSHKAPCTVMIVKTD
jgi:nucleotide-binding universal stress UspA family protein